MQACALHQANHQIRREVAAGRHARVIVRPSPQDGNIAHLGCRFTLDKHQRGVTVFQRVQQRVGRQPIAQHSQQQRPAGYQHLPGALTAREPQQEQSGEEKLKR